MPGDAPLDIAGGDRTALGMLAAYRSAETVDDLGAALNGFAADQPLWTTTIGLLRLSSELLDYLSETSGSEPDDLHRAIGRARRRRQFDGEEDFDESI